MHAQVLATQDLYLHIATGRWILTGRSIPDHGIFSGSIPTAPWTPHEWLAAVSLALLHDHLGWTGVVVAISALLAVAIGILARETAGTLGPAGALAAALLAWGLCVGHLVARPHVAALPLVVIWIAAHVRARQTDRAPPFYLVPIVVIWANLHGSFLFGLAFTAMFAAEAAFEATTIAASRTAAWRWGRFFAVSVAAATLTPHGLEGLLFPIQLASMSTALETVYEWQASSLANNAPLILWLLMLIFLSLLIGISLPICRLIMVMVLLYMAFAHRRHSELLGLVTPLLLRDAIAARLNQLSSSWASNFEVLQGKSGRACLLGLTAAAAIVSGVILFRGIDRGADRYTPRVAVAAVEASRIQGPVLNAYNFGGYLIFRGFAPFVDGRVDMYGNAFMDRYNKLGELPALLDQYKIVWTILEPANPRTALMDALPGWSRLHSDDAAVVHLRAARPSH